MQSYMLALNNTFDPVVEMEYAPKLACFKYPNDSIMLADGMSDKKAKLILTGELLGQGQLILHLLYIILNKM